MSCNSKYGSMNASCVHMGVWAWVLLIVHYCMYVSLEVIFFRPYTVCMSHCCCPGSDPGGLMAPPPLQVNEMHNIHFGQNTSFIQVKFHSILGKMSMQKKSLHESDIIREVDIETRNNLFKTHLAS